MLQVFGFYGAILRSVAGLRFCKVTEIYKCVMIIKCYQQYFQLLFGCQIMKIKYTKHKCLPNFILKIQKVKKKK